MAAREDSYSGDKVADVGILTFHRCINYGSYWQSRQLQEGLASRGFRTVILDHCSEQAKLAEWRCALRPTLPIPVSKTDRLEYECKTRKFLHAFESLPLSQPFDLDHPVEAEPVRTLVVGSDEVWNLQHPWFAGQPAFFGQGLRAKRTIAYAASFGNYSCWHGVGSPWTDFLASFDALSVRDENSWWMIKNCLGIEAEVVLDPCLQWPPSLSETNRPRPPYALVYGHGFSDDFARKVRAWATDRGLPLVSIGYRNDWADSQWLSADPHEFARAMAGAVAVATNFFHGCIFALANEKPFACELSNYRSIKIRGLAELLVAQKHLVHGETDEESVRRLLDDPISDQVKSRIVELRQQSNAYLDRSL